PRPAPQAAGISQFPQRGEPLVLRHHARRARFLFAVISLEWKVLDSPRDVMGAVQSYGPSIGGKVQFWQVSIHVDVKDRNVGLFEELPHQRADRQRRRSLPR